MSAMSKLQVILGVSERSKVPPNPSLNRTRYGKRRKPELRHMVHHLSSGLRRLPPRAG
jgi:hypothetical protein